MPPATALTLVRTGGLKKITTWQRIYIKKQVHKTNILWLNQCGAVAVSEMDDTARQHRGIITKAKWTLPRGSAFFKASD
jgi:hypothetical protein